MKTITGIRSIFFFHGLCLLVFQQTVDAQTFDQRYSTSINTNNVSGYSGTNPNQTEAHKSLNPLIISCINQVNADSMRSTIQHLQDFGTRFSQNENRKEIATWLIQKFNTFGYTNNQVKLDSFQVNWGGVTYWQYNVVCALEGSNAPKEEYHIGAHYDSYSTVYPDTLAPGADDNGSGVASVMETARVMKKMNFQPESTIKFFLWAFEEGGGYGSIHNAKQARLNGDDVRYYLNLDMVAHDPANEKQVYIFRFLGCEYAGNFTADIFQQYSSLSVFFFPDLKSSVTDSWSYWLNHFPTTGVEEKNFNPSWHKPSDTIGNCNFTYLADVTKGVLASMMELQFLPYPIGLFAKSSTKKIDLGWKPTANKHITGYNLYRAEELEFSNTIRLNNVPITDSSYTDTTTLQGVQYYYRLTLLNDSARESLPGQIVTCARFVFCDTLLVVSALKGNALTPDSIRTFYATVLDSIPFHWFDLNKNNHLDFTTISRYRNILFMINSFTFEYPDTSMLQNFSIFFGNGGNMLFSGFLPSLYFDYNNTYPSKLPDESYLASFFKVDSVSHKINSIMNKAKPAYAGYDTLHVDPQKTLDPSYPGELFHIEVFTPGPAANITYRFNSRFPPSTNQGLMQDKPVGLEYIGSDYKSILLSFPLYYIDITDARKFIKYVLKNKFNQFTSIENNDIQANQSALNIYPNPLQGQTNFSIHLDQSGSVKLSVFNMQGAQIYVAHEKQVQAGDHIIPFNATYLPSGIYNVLLQTNKSVISKKMIVVK
ncbi:MAG: M20/M25/M40 family metallo-hydrolase [Bacteroidales bacterium]|nr:M20/M25/M40 family metallo-hydrolase [Bacteroidales bacterium]